MGITNMGTTLHGVEACMRALAPKSGDGEGGHRRKCRQGLQDPMDLLRFRTEFGVFRVYPHTT